MADLLLRGGQIQAYDERADVPCRDGETVELHQRADWEVTHACATAACRCG